MKLSVTLWAIWAARRKAIHEGIFQSPHSTHSFITRFIDELDMLKVKPPQVTGAGVAIRSGRPIAPPQGHAKINVDAGVRKGSRGTSVAVCRDESGAYLGSSSLAIVGLDDPEALEAIACREGLALAADLQLQNFVISSDSKHVISDINKGCRGSTGAVISEIKILANSFQCNFIFESRASNMEAHSLAKSSLSLGPGRHVWFGQPPDPRCIPQFVVFDE